MRSYLIDKEVYDLFYKHSDLYDGWSKAEKVREFDATPCVSSGILVKVKRGHVGITHSIDDQGKCAETMVIPRKAITKMEIISTFRK